MKMLLHMGEARRAGSFFVQLKGPQSPEFSFVSDSRVVPKCPRCKGPVNCQPAAELGMCYYCPWIGRVMP